jgi:hypothetical protein
MGAGFSSIKPEQMAVAVGPRPVMRIQPVQDSKTRPVKKEDDKTGKAKEQKEEKDTSHQTVDEIQNKFGF